MADDGRLAITIAAPNAVMAVRRVTGPVDDGRDAGIFECRIFLLRSFDRDHG